MMNIEILKNIVMPILIAIFFVRLVWFFVDLFFKLVKFNKTFIKIIFTILIWYFLGPLVYTWLLKELILESYVWVEALYRPFVVLLKILV